MKTILPDERVTIGKVLKTRGVRGEVKVLPLTDIPNRFEQLEAVYVNSAQNQDVTLEIEHVSYYKGFVYLRFKGLNSIEDVQDFVGHLLQVERKDVPVLPEGVYYHFEIIDSQVYTEDLRYLGKVVNILETGSNDVYIVQNDEREYLIPSTREVVTHIDRKKKVITVHPIEGLLDL